ncbi:transposase [Acinetobacter baumannii]|uniref:IS66 family transposase n=1 Tax=Acinetobacter baumannii TaxID=470 RepID=UPI0022352B18|nr:transposase [Acinetobacter baumannii]
MAQPTSSDSAIEFSTAKAINYTLKRWPALSRYLDDGNLPICNNWVENQMRPWALGRKNWLFAGSLRSGQRAANIMTLISKAEWLGSVCLFK